MKIKCNREKFLAAFQTAAAVAPARSPKPILQNVRIEVTDEATTLMATDLEIGIRLLVSGVEVEAPGAAVLPISRFGAILRESSDETLRLEADVQGTLVQGERSEFRLPAEDPNEFPAVGLFEEEKFIELPARLFREMIRRTIFATDNESSRYALGGVKLEPEGNRITAVGTDGRRLAKMEGPCSAVGGDPPEDASIIVPARAMQLLERAISDDDAEIQIATRANELLVKSPRATIYSRLLEGRFPRWRDVFPTREQASKIDLPVGAIQSAVRQAAIATSEESRGIDFTFGGGNLVLSGKAAEVGQARVELPIGFDGPEITITLDPRFILDFLKVLDPDKTFRLEIENGERAAVGSTDDGYGYVIMPLARDR